MSVDLSGVDVSGLPSMSQMFAGCTSLEEVDLSALEMVDADPEMGEVGESTAAMFKGCTALKSLTVPALFAWEMEGMFSGCTALASLDLSALSIDYGDMGMPLLDGLCEGFDSLVSIHLGAGFAVPQSYTIDETAFPSGLWQSSADGQYYVLADVPQGVDATYTRVTKEAGDLPFAVLSGGTLSISSVDPTQGVPQGDAVYLLDEAATYSQASDVPWHEKRDAIKKVTVDSSAQFASCAYWFADCGQLEEAALSGLNASHAKSLACMFLNCGKLASVNLAGINTSRTTDFSGMFRNCPTLTELDASSLDTRKAIDMRRMFHGCDNLARIAIGVDFVFRGQTLHRLPGSEFPAGAWRQGETDTAYVSDSIPSMKAAAYTKLSEEEVGQAGITIVQITLEGDGDAEPLLQVEATINDEGAEELVYDVSDDYPGDTLYVGDSPRAASTKTLPASTTKVTKTTLRAVRNNSRITKVVVPAKVSGIASRAFEGTNVKTLSVKSAKLTTKSRVLNCLKGSKVGKVTASSMSAAKKKQVKSAFAKWSGKRIKTA